MNSVSRLRVRLLRPMMSSRSLRPLRHPLVTYNQRRRNKPVTVDAELNTIYDEGQPVGRSLLRSRWHYPLPRSTFLSAFSVVLHFASLSLPLSFSLHSGLYYILPRSPSLSLSLCILPPSLFLSAFSVVLHFASLSLPLSFSLHSASLSLSLCILGCITFCLALPPSLFLSAFSVVLHFASLSLPLSFSLHSRLYYILPRSPSLSLSLCILGCITFCLALPPSLFLSAFSVVLH